MLGYSAHTLRHWRQGRKRWTPDLPGPRFFSIHGRIFYTPEGLEDWAALYGADSDFVGENRR